MHEVAPFILLLLSWFVDDPKSSMSVERRLVMSAEECTMHGAEFEAQRDTDQQEFKGRAFKYVCIPLPDEKEFSAMIENAK